MQILELVLYGKNGQKRTLSFNPGKVNIIPGESKAGKSAVGDIIEYCMGGSSCNIAVGVVRDNVAWYGLLLQFNTNRIFVARKNPDPGRQSTSFCYYELGTDIRSPEKADFSSNTNVEGIEKLLRSRAGSVDILIDLAELFNVTLDYLILGKTDQTDQAKLELEQVQMHLERLASLL